MSCLLVMALGLVFTPAHAEHLSWKGLILGTRHEVLVEALALTAAETPAFRVMLARGGHDPDAYLGGLISMLPPVEGEIFAARFGVEDPVYGTPAQMRAFTPRFKAVLMRLAMRRMSAADLARVRARALSPTAREMELFEIFLRWAPSPIAAELFFETWDTISSHCDERLARA